jgi:hypothetical protein
LRGVNVGSRFIGLLHRINANKLFNRRQRALPIAGTVLWGKRFEPSVDSLSNGFPLGLDHHVMTHVREDFCFGAVGTRGRADFLLCEAAVAFGT